MSKITAVAYYKGIPPNNKNPEKPEILNNFCSGVAASGDTVIAHQGMEALPCDVALIQGYVHDHGKQAPHLKLRQDAINLQKKNNKKSLIVDSNLFLYRDNGNSKTYLRYSFDGVFPTDGFYFDKDIDPNRWIKISRSLGMNLQPWRTNGKHILICIQRSGGWSMGGVDVQTWLDSTISILQRLSNRHIIVRTHPGDKKIKSYLRINHRNVSTSSPERTLLQDLHGAWATVVYNSSPSVASVIEGIPTFITDPIPRRSQAFEVANTNLNAIENPVMPDRQQWIEKISMCHWNFEELRSGEAWNFFKRYI